MTVSGALTSPKKNAPSGSCPLTTWMAGSVAATSGGVGVGGSTGGTTAVSVGSISVVGSSVAGDSGAVVWVGTAVFTTASISASCWTISAGIAGSLDSAPLQAANRKVIHAKKRKTYFMQLIIARCSYHRVRILTIRSRLIRFLTNMYSDGAKHELPECNIDIVNFAHD